MVLTSMLAARQSGHSHRIRIAAKPAFMKESEQGQTLLV